MQEYLQSCSVIDWQHPEVSALAKSLSADSDLETAKACFLFVRDKIRHSLDSQDTTVTLSASQVLHEQTGYCYAKSHLLAALLRANSIPAALCYQRLSIDGVGAPYCLHGLSAVYLNGIGWYRIDARGNKAGVNAEFCPPKEALAFTTDNAQEIDIKGYYSKPLPVVIEALTNHQSVQDLYLNLPDWKF